MSITLLAVGQQPYCRIGGSMETLFIVLAFIGMFGCGYFCCLLLFCLYVMGKENESDQH